MRCGAAIEALHAAEFSKEDLSLYPNSKSCMVDRVPCAMRLVPKLGQRLTVCAVWAKACFVELENPILSSSSSSSSSSKEEEEEETISSSTEEAEEGEESPHFHCSKSAEQGVFGMVYELIMQGLQVSYQCIRSGHHHGRRDKRPELCLAMACMLQAAHHSVTVVTSQQGTALYRSHMFGYNRCACICIMILA